MGGTYVRIALAVFVVVGLAAPVVALDRRALDDDQYLATTSAVIDFREDGVVSETYPTIQLTVTVSTTPQPVDAPGFQLAPLRRFIRVDYNESIPREVRLHLHEDIISPRPSRGTSPIDADQPKIDLVVPSDGHQSMTLHLEEETHAVYAVSDVNGEVWGVRRSISDFWSNSTGISLPAFGSGEWQRPPEDAMEGSSPTYAIANSEGSTDMTIQYAADGGESWLTVPACDSDAPVCRLQRNNQTVLFASDPDPPAIRYKFNRDVLAGIKSAIDDLESVPGDALEAVQGFLGGGSG